MIPSHVLVWIYLALYFRLQPIVEVKEEVDGSMSIFSNDEELSHGRLVCRSL